MTTKEYKSIFSGFSTISENEYQRYVERNQSDKMRNFISKRNQDPEFKRKCKEGSCTEEIRRIKSDNMRRISKKCWEDPEYRRRRSDSAREVQERESKKPEVIKRKSDLFKRLWSSNSDFVNKAISAPKSHPYGRQSHYQSDKFDQTYYCRSQGESDFIRLCEELDYVTSLSPGSLVRIPYFSENEFHTYIPDFIVNNKYVVEVKYENDNIENHSDKANAAVEYCKLNGLVFCYVNRFSGISKIRESGFESVVILQRI